MRTDVLTKKQRNVLEVINKFGLITLKQVLNYMDGEASLRTVYKAKDRLSLLQFIDEVKFGKHLLLHIKDAGVTYLDSPLPGISRISYSTLQHTLTINDCIIATRRMYGDRGKEFHFLTERELRREYLNTHFPDGDVDFKKLRHVSKEFPDFVIMSLGDVLANEVELNVKSVKRYEEKFSRYRSELLKGTYTRIIYLAPNSAVMNAVSKAGYKVLDHKQLRIVPIEQVIKSEG